MFLKGWVLRTKYDGKPDALLTINTVDDQVDASLPLPLHHVLLLEHASDYRNPTAECLWSEVISDPLWY